MPLTTYKPEKKIRVLLLEDRATDAELILRQLRRAGFEPDCHCVDTEQEFVSRLDSPIDIILADYRLPQFDGLAALRHVQQRNLDIPFLIIAGALGEEVAARCIKQGVTDYLLKDRLDRLGLAVSNALDERRLRVERKLIDERLRQAQKMEAVGQLAGGIAHDFSNVLTIINGRLWLLLENESFPAETTESLKQVHQAGERAANLTRQLLYFSRKRPIERRSLNLNTTVGEMTDMLRRLIGENIGLDIDLDPLLPPVEADENMMEQIMINLAVNARDAMPGGGAVTFGTRAVARTREDVRGQRGARPGDFACLWVRDGGCGIPIENQHRIFEPFFTTKEAGKGTGLGLATVMSIVQQHQGWLEMETTVGVGTTFKVFLPVAISRAVISDEPEGGADTVKGGEETILIVEDDADVRKVTAAALRIYGYNVLEAGSGIEAFDAWRHNPSRIDILLTDMVMPGGVSGPELAEKMQCERPELPVIFATGYSSESLEQTFDSRINVQFIHKPFHSLALARLVREVLDSGKTGNGFGSGPHETLAQTSL